MNLYVAIPTYNRPELLRHSLRSLALANQKGPVEIHLFDDCSEQLDWPPLRNEFPDIKFLHIAEKNQGPDGNLLRILKAFSHSDSSHLLILDSDSVVHESIFQFIFQLDTQIAAKPQEIWSLYRSRFHTEIEIDHLNQKVQKASLGALGLILPRSLVEQFLESSFVIKGLDWQLMFFLIKKGCRFYTPLQSLVQHIGWEGSHNEIGSPDYALNFQASNSADIEILEQLTARSRAQTPKLKSRLLTFYRMKMNSLYRFRFRQWIRQWFHL